MSRIKKRVISAAMAAAMLLSLSVSALAADKDNSPLDNDHNVSLRILSEEEEGTSWLPNPDSSVRTATMFLKRNNHDGTNGTKITSFTAEHETAMFKITIAASTETYNVTCLDSEGNEVANYHTGVSLNRSVTVENLTVGEKYTFRVSSDDCPENGCTATYELKY